MNCECGHPEVAHEVVVRCGRAWFTLDAVPSDELRSAVLEERVWMWCGHCEDGCYTTSLPAASLTQKGTQ